MRWSGEGWWRGGAESERWAGEDEEANVGGEEWLREGAARREWRGKELHGRVAKSLQAKPTHGQLASTRR